MKLSALLLLAACGDDVTNTGPDAQLAADGSFDALPADRVTLAGMVRDLDVTKPLDATMQALLPGVEVCLLVPGEARRCMTTGADARWAFDAPKLRKGIGLTMSIAGHSPVYTLLSTLDVNELDSVIFLGRDADVSAFMQHFQATYPLGTHSGVMMHAYHHVAPDYLYLEGGTASASQGAGPFYMAGPWTYTANQVTTTAAGYGYAVFPDIDASVSTVDVTVELAGATCFALRDSVSLVGQDTMRVPVLSGFFTNVAVVCE